MLAQKYSAYLIERCSLPMSPTPCEGERGEGQRQFRRPRSPTHQNNRSNDNIVFVAPLVNPIDADRVVVVVRIRVGRIEAGAGI